MHQGTAIDDAYRISVDMMGQRKRVAHMPTATTAISNAAASAHVATVITNNVLYHCPTRRVLQDVVTCIRLHTTMDNAGFQLERHADRFLKPPEEMLRLFPGYEHAVRRTWEFAERCRFSLDQLTYSYPTEELEDGLSAQDRLEKPDMGRCCTAPSGRFTG